MPSKNVDYELETAYNKSIGNGGEADETITGFVEGQAQPQTACTEGRAPGWKDVANEGIWPTVFQKGSLCHLLQQSTHEACIRRRLRY